MKELEKREKQYQALVDDIDFKKLEERINAPNIFKVLKIDNYEIRHSNFLAWLLNPKENHKLKDTFLKGFLKEVLTANKVKGQLIDIEKLNFSNVRIKREREDTDLLIIFDSANACIS